MKRLFLYMHPDATLQSVREFFGDDLSITIDPLEIHPVMDETCPFIHTEGVWFMMMYINNEDLRGVRCSYEPATVSIEKHVPVVFIGGNPDRMSVALSNQLDTDRVTRWSPGCRVKSAAKHPS
jgi:hypothetical protein